VSVSLRFLADESCDFAVVRKLREASFDVRAVSEIAAGAPDEDVIRLASVDGRIVLTEDRDFGRLVFAAARSSSGVLFIRFPASRRAELGARVLHAVQAAGESLRHSFVVVGPDRIRIRQLP
jgi:predicted nuclease of predicted toxin-antitoxin system